MYRVSSHLPRFALALLFGALAATLWVNLAPDTYFDVMEYRLWSPAMPAWTAVPDPVLTLQLITSEGLMALFIFFIAKELWEALVLEHGSLSGPGRRAMPLGAVLGGVIGAVVLWLATAGLDVGLSSQLGDGSVADAGLSVSTGWPLPVGSDVVLCYVFGARVFGRDHPALHLLLLIAIAFDILGLLALGLAFPFGALRPVWLLVPVLALAAVWPLSARYSRPQASEVQHRRAAALWPWLLAGVLSWAGMVLAGLPGALGLLPLVPLVPHAGRSFGLFAEAEELLHDPLNRLAHYLVWPLPLVLFLFGLTRGGVELSAIGPMTLRVLATLWLGKPLGLLIGAGAVVAMGRGALPAGLRISDLLLIAVLSGIGLTVPLLGLDYTLPGGVPEDQARAGVALSLCFGPLALGLARLRQGLRARPRAKESS